MNPSITGGVEGSRMQADASPPSPRTQRRQPASSRDRADRKRRLVAWCLLAPGALFVLITVVAAVPHPYAGWGIAFLLVAIPAILWKFQERGFRIGLITIIVFLTGVAVVALNIRATQTLTIRNDSGIAIRYLELSFIQRSDGVMLRGSGIPANFSEARRFFLPGFDGRNASASGELANGTPISSYSPFGQFLSPFKLDYHRHVTIIIQPDGSVEWQYP